MDPDQAAQEHLDLSREFLGSALDDLARGRLAPARFSSLHALELAVKAALLAKTRRMWETHNVGGAFGQHFRGRVEDEVPSRVAKLMTDYGRSRYPEWEPIARDQLTSDIAFVATIVEGIVPMILKEARP